MSSHLKVFVIDDAMELCQDLRRWLEEAGHQVECSPAKPSLLANFTARSPDLFVLGLGRGAEQGLDVYRRLKNHRQLRHIPIILVSDDAELEYVMLDVYDFQARPFDRTRLLNSLDRLSRLRREGRGYRPLQLSSEQLQPFKQFLVAHSGLHFSPRNQRLLERGVLQRMSSLHLHDPAQYHDYLVAADQNYDELNKLLGLLTVGETSFFRYRSHHDALVQVVFPELIRKATAPRRLRIWSAGCSTGEEPYSVAMMLLRHFPQVADWDVQILATDINKRALRHAREGVYGVRALRQTDATYRQLFFKETANHFQLEDRVRRLVRFRYLNLQVDPFPSAATGTTDLDLVLCRNVLIYFELETIREIVDRFRQCLKPKGYLFMGHSETMQNVSDRFQRQHQQGAFYYQLKEPVTAARPTLAAPSPAPISPPRPVSPVSKPAPAPAPAPVVPEPSLPAPPNPQRLYEQAMDAFDHESYAEAERLFDEILQHEPEHSRALVGKGLIQANRGAYDEARQFGARAIRFDDLCPEAYLLRGLILDMEGQLQRALVEYQKVLWLEADFIMAHYLLAKIHARLQQPEAMLRALRNTIRSLERFPAAGCVPFSGGLTRAVFLEVCHRELASHRGEHPVR